MKYFDTDENLYTTQLTIISNNSDTTLKTHGSQLSLTHNTDGLHTGSSTCLAAGLLGCASCASLVLFRGVFGLKWLKFHGENHTPDIVCNPSISDP